ncbi:MAG: MmgE/PrpD family protein [Burkholderiales bacterium]
MDTTTTTPAATACLGDWVSRLRYEHIPAAVIAHIKWCLLDGLGCGLYGARQPWGVKCTDYARQQSPDGPSSLWGSPWRSGPADAALANGTAVHGFEIDDVHLRSLIHPGAVTIPAALAVAEARHSSGRVFLSSLVAGYEVGLRVGVCAGIPHQLRGYHPTGTVGSVGAAAAVANLLQLAPSAATDALAIGATQASGLYAAVRTGAMVKRLHAGRAAQSGVIAGLLAEEGLTGSPDALEAPLGGFMGTLGHEQEPREMTRGLGERWETAEVGFKAYAACASAHTIIDAVLAMRKKGLSGENLGHLQIRMSKSAMNNVGWPYQPSGVVAAQMNGYYAAAVTLLDGEAFVDQYAEARLADPRIIELGKRMAITHDPDLDVGGASTRHAVIATAQLAGGEVLSERVEQRRGSGKYPLSASEIELKFRRTAGAVFGPARLDAIGEFVDTLEKQTDMQRLGGLLMTSSDH